MSIPPDRAILATILEFVEDLRTHVFPSPADSGELLIVRQFFSLLPVRSVADHVVRHVLPHASQIRSRDEKFFLDNKSIFAGLPDARVHYYSSAWEDGRIDDENKAVIWQYFDTLIAYASRIS